MQYGEGRTKIEGLDKIKSKEIKKKREILENGTIVYCKGSQSTSSFIGIVYDNCRVLEIENGSSAYINSDNYIHLGDMVGYWTIEKVLKTRLVIDEVLKEME